MTKRLRWGLPALALGALLLAWFLRPDGDDRHPADAPHRDAAPESSSPVLLGSPLPSVPPDATTTPSTGTAAGSDDTRAPEGAFVAGRVVFPGGARGDRVAVGFRSLAPSGTPGKSLASTRTDERGRFRLDGIRAGPCRLCAPDDGSPQTQTRAHTGDDDVLLTVHARRVRAMVEDAHGNPVPDADLGMRWFRETGPTIGRAPVRPDGCVDLWLEPGTRVILAAHASGFRVAERDVTVTEDLLRRDVHLVLPDEVERRGLLRLRLTDPTGDVVTRATAWLQSPLAHSNLDRRPAPHEIDEDGGPVSLPVGRWHVIVYADDAHRYPYEGYFLPLHLDVEIEADREVVVERQMDWGGRIRVNDRRPKDAEVVAWVDLEKNGRPTRYSISLEPGEACRGPLLETGTWTMVFRDEEGREVRRDVVIRPGETLEVE